MSNYKALCNPFWLKAILVLLLFTGVQDLANAQWGDRSFENSGQSDWNRRWESGDWNRTNNLDRQWTLGVTGNHTNVGFIVGNVGANTPAAKAGIRRDDAIICVGNDRIGRVGNQIYELNDEINRHADSMGRVEVLVQEARTRQLKSLNVQLNNLRAGLTGRLVLQGVRLPSDSIVTLKLENVSRPTYQVRNGENTFRVSASTTNRLPFELNFDPNYIFSNDTYRLQAYVTSRGRTILVSQRPPLVLTRGNPNNVDITLSPTTFYDEFYGRPVQYQGQLIPVTDNRDQIITAYRQYLNRYPTNVELAAWQQSSEISWNSSRLPIELLATQEYYNRSGGNDSMWIQSSFNAIVGRQPSGSELNNWLRRFSEVRFSRTELLRQLVRQSGG